MKKHTFPRARQLGSRTQKHAALILAASTLLFACEEKEAPVATAAASKPAELAAKAAPLASSLPASDPAPAPTKPKKKLEDCPTGKELVVDHAELEASIRVKAQKPEGPLTQADLKKLRSLNLSRVVLDHLDICLFTHMTELRELFIAPTGIDDLSPISNSKKLETLGVAGNPVSDLTPLSGMTHMDRLDLAKTKVSDLSPLAKMSQLTELTLDGSEVTDLSGVTALTKLERLSIKSTQIKDLKPLTTLKTLKFLYIAESAAESDIGQTGALVQNGTKVMRD